MTIITAVNSTCGTVPLSHEPNAVSAGALRIVPHIVNMVPLTAPITDATRPTEKICARK
jgi:hypothetical protein